MPGKGKRFEKGNAGRPKGAKNKFTCLKDSFLEAFEGIGGTQELIEWAKKTQNRPQFYQMIARMLPKQEVSEEDCEAVKTNFTITFVNPGDRLLDTRKED